MISTSVTTVALAALITALATGLGAVPFLFARDLGHRWVSIANAVAGGLMLGASHGLIQEGFVYDEFRTIAGLLVGVTFIALSQKLLGDQHGFHVGELRGADALKVLMIVGVMTVHSFSEGVGVGVSFGGGQELGGLITLAIAVHNIPEGLAISLVLVPRGTSAWRAAGWSVFSSLPQPLMAVPAFLFVTAFRPFLPVGLGVAGGAMIWMVVAELIPDALDDASGALIATVLSLSFAAMLIFQALI